MSSIRNGLVVVACVFVGFVTAAGPGLVARAAEPPRWLERAIAPRDASLVPGAGKEQRRIAELEQQLQELKAGGGARRGGSMSSETPRELEAVVAHNRELTAQNRALAAENQALTQRLLFEPPVTAATCEPPRDEEPLAQIRYWAQRLRDGKTSHRSRLTTAQNAAVQVLLRPERELDPSNPWREHGPQTLASAQ